MAKTCSRKGCAKPVNSRGLCRAHYRYWQRHKDELPEPPTLFSLSPEERFMEKVGIVPGGCWEWLGYRMPAGYGMSGRHDLAHRVSYKLFVGPIPEGLDLDHLCRNRGCVCPWHLEPVTRQINLLRGETVTARHARTTHCPNGHEYTPENTHYYRGSRDCKACWRAPFRKGVVTSE